MKKMKFITICCVAVLSGGIAVSMDKSEKSGSNDLQLQNVDALSYNEMGYDRGCLGPGAGCTTDWDVWHPDEKGWG